MQILSNENPTWGRRALATAINEEYGTEIVSPGWVGRTLGELSARRREDSTAPDRATRTVDLRDVEHIRSVMREGVVSGRGNRYGECIDKLGPIWRVIAAGALTALSRPRSDTLSWVVRGGIQLGHAYIHTGRWHLARDVFEYLSRHWRVIRSLEEPAVSMSASDVWTLYAGSPTWEAGPIVDRGQPIVTSVNIGSRANHVEIMQYLAIIYRRSRQGEGFTHLRDALSTLGSRPWHDDPERWTVYTGVINHDLGRLHLMRTTPDIAMARTRLANAEALLAGSDVNMEIMTQVGIAIADVKGAIIGENTAVYDRVAVASRVQRRLERAAALDGPHVAGITRIKYAVQAAELMLTVGDDAEVDWSGVRSVAELCVEQRLNHQATRLIRLPRLGDHLDTQTMARLFEMAGEVF